MFKSDFWWRFTKIDRKRRLIKLWTKEALIHDKYEHDKIMKRILSFYHEGNPFRRI